MKRIIIGSIISPFIIVTFYWTLDKYTHYLFNIKGADAENGIEFLNVIFTLLLVAGIIYLLFKDE